MGVLGEGGVMVKFLYLFSGGKKPFTALRKIIMKNVMFGDVAPCYVLLETTNELCGQVFLLQ